MVEKSADENQTSGSKIILVIGAVIIIILIAVIVFLLSNKQKKEEPKRNVVVNQKNAEEVAGELISQEYVEPGYYSVEMSTRWHFETGDAISEDAYVANRPENTNDIYFDVFLADDESEAILESPVIPRGSEMINISLNQSLKAGTYDCVMIYHLVDEKQITVSTLRVGLTIVVEK